MDLSKYQVKKHPAKAIFRKHKIKLAVVSQFLDLGYNYVSSILNGVIKPTPEVHEKLMELADSLEKSGGSK